MVQDLPDGNFAELQKKGKKLKAKLGRESIYILGNYRMWCLAACYAVSFGVEVWDPNRGPGRGKSACQWQQQDLQHCDACTWRWKLL